MPSVNERVRAVDELLSALERADWVALALAGAVAIVLMAGLLFSRDAVLRGSGSPFLAAWLTVVVFGLVAAAYFTIFSHTSRRLQADALIAANQRVGVASATREQVLDARDRDRISQVHEWEEIVPVTTAYPRWLAFACCPIAAALGWTIWKTAQRRSVAA